MGLDAYVLCNCYEEGKISKPPVDESLIVFNDNDYELNLQYNSNEDKFSQFDIWRQSACSHKDFKYAEERISNWSGCELFLNSLRGIGADYFLTLLNEWPKANDGSMSPESAEKALRELDVFSSMIERLNGVYLIDYESNDIIFETTEHHKAIFALSGKDNSTYGISAEGFFVTVKNDVRFLSSDFFQIVH